MATVADEETGWVGGVAIAAAGGGASVWACGGRRGRPPAGGCYPGWTAGGGETPWQDHTPTKDTFITTFPSS